MKLNSLRRLEGSGRVDSARIEGGHQMPGETQDAGASVTGESSHPPWAHIRNI